MNRNSMNARFLCVFSMVTLIIIGKINCAYGSGYLGEPHQSIKKGSKASKSHKTNNAHEKAQKEAERLKQGLSLSQEQFSKIFNVAVERERSLNYLKVRKDLNKLEKKAEHDSLWSHYTAKLKTILSPEQFQLYEEK